MGNEDWVTVASPGTDLEAALLKGLLEGAGIGVRTRPRGFKTLAGAFGGANLPGAVDLLVHPDDVYEAKLILRAEPDEPGALEPDP